MKTPNSDAPNNTRIIFFAACCAAWISIQIQTVLWSGSLFGTDTVHTAPIRGQARPSSCLTEAYVISFDPDKAKLFNTYNHNISALWVHAVDGFHQRNLDLWSQISGQQVINASRIDKSTDKHKGLPQSPHAVGCYLAHWQLLRQLAHRKARPDAYFVFEDDSRCIPDVVARTSKVIKALPEDWDMLYIGGKPFTYFTGPTQVFEDSEQTSFARDVCRGGFGIGEGPLAPDGTRKLKLSQKYWRPTYLTNTHSYVINPKRVHRVVNFLHPKVDLPIDIRLAMAMKEQKLNVYMSTQMFCEQNKPLIRPIPWEGYYGINTPNRSEHPATKDKMYHWQEILQKDGCKY